MSPPEEEAMSRIPMLAPEDLDDDQRRAFASITRGPRGGAGRAALVDDRGALLGPFNAMVTAPTVGEPLQALGAAIRYRTGLSARARELAILTVAAHHRSDFEWEVHVRDGRAAGLTDTELAAAIHGDPAALTDPTERVVLRTTRAMLRTGDLTDDEYTTAVAAIGEARLVELTTLVGYYALLALQLRVFRVPARVTGPWTAQTAEG
ncbi:carboxymuconolactone decarboxylase family protein [Polymorphospora sp. NPDC050346]|uniref:carboxymuconolactone decarboxylase family protein n=1 Tax=Polymorphospora sp. NPDC050346 TaxID=3155780 RepID=UPI0033FEA233